MIKLIEIIILFFGASQIICAEFSSFKNIIKKLRKNEFEAYQTIIIHDEKNQNSDEILQATFSNNPSRMINTDNNPNEFKSIASRYFHKQTLFIVIIENNETKIEKFFNFIKNISNKFTFPKCLMIILTNKKNNSREDLLRSAWSRNFIHLTILDVENKNSPRNLIGQNQKNLIIHHFNKFTNNYTMINYSKKSVIFPEKLKNLNGFKLRRCKDTKYHQNSRDKKFQIFSKIMNFKDKKISNINNCIKNKSIKIDIVSCTNLISEYSEYNNCHLTSNLYADRISNKSEYSKNRVYQLLPGNFLYLVPKKKIVNYLFMKSFYQGTLIFFILLLIWKFLRSFKFNGEIWKFWHLWEALLGLSISLNVKHFSDKIIMIFTLLGCLLLSSALQSILTSIQIDSNYEDILLSMDYSTKWEFKIIKNYSIHALDIVGIKTPLSLNKRNGNCETLEDCLGELLENKAVACRVNRKLAKHVLLMDLKRNNIQTIKIFSFGFSLFDFDVTDFEENSPFTFEFERQMTRFMESGLNEKFYEANENIKMIQEDKVNLSENNFELPISPFIFLGIGLGISFIVFLGEIFIFIILLLRYNYFYN